MTIIIISSSHQSMGICNLSKPQQSDLQKNQLGNKYINSHYQSDAILPFQILTQEEKNNATSIQSLVDRGFTSLQVDDRSSQIHIPAIGEIIHKYQQKNQYQDIAPDSIKLDQNILNNKGPLSNSTEDLMVPDASEFNPLDSSSFFNNSQIDKVLMSNHFSLQHYKNFSKVNLYNFQRQIFQQNVFTCLSLFVFELIAQNLDKLSKIRDEVVRFAEFKPINPAKSSEHKTDQYGEIRFPDQIKKLFLQYLNKIYENQSSVEIIQNYSILPYVLQSVLITYVVEKSVSRSSEIYQKYQNMDFDNQFMQNVKVILNIQFQNDGTILKFKEGKRQCKIQKQMEGKVKGQLIR